MNNAFSFQPMKTLLPVGLLLAALGLAGPAHGASEMIRGRVMRAEVDTATGKLIGFRGFGFVGGPEQSAGPNPPPSRTYYKTVAYVGSLSYQAPDGGVVVESINGGVTLKPSQTLSITLPLLVQLGASSQGSNPALESEGIPAEIETNTIHYRYVPGNRGHPMIDEDGTANSVFFPAWTLTRSGSPPDDPGAPPQFRAVIAHRLAGTANQLFGENYFSDGRVSPVLDAEFNFSAETELNDLARLHPPYGGNHPMPPAGPGNLRAFLSNPDSIDDVLARSTWNTRVYSDATIGQAPISSGASAAGRDVTAHKARFRIGGESASVGCDCATGSRYLAYISVFRSIAGGGGSTTVMVVPVTMDGSHMSKEEITLPFDTISNRGIGDIWLEPLDVCSTCNAGGGAPAGYGPGASAGSVEFQVALAKSTALLSPARLRLRAEQISTALYSVDALTYLPVVGDTSTVRVDVGGHLRQIQFNGGLLDVAVTSTESYELRFHTADQLGATNPDGTRNVSGSPYLKWVVKNPDAAPGLSRRLSIARVANGLTIETLYAEEIATGKWTVSEGNGLRVTTEEILALTANDKTVRVTVADGQGVVAAQKEVHYRMTGAGWTWTGEINDPNGRALVRSDDSQTLASETHHLDQAATTDIIDRYSGGRELLSTEERFANNVMRLTVHNRTTANDVDGDGQPEAVHRIEILNPAAPDDSGGGASAIRAPGTAGTNGKNSSDPGERPVAASARAIAPRGVAQVLGSPPSVSRAVELPANPLTYQVELSKRLVEAGTGDKLRVVKSIVAASTTDAWNAGANLVTTERFYESGPFNGELTYRLRPDQVLTTVQFSLNSSTGALTRIERVGAPSANLESVIDGMETTTVTNAAGHETSRVVRDIASYLVTDSMTVTAFDGFGRPTAISYPGGRTETRVYSACCGLLESVTRDGVTTMNAYDDLGRLIFTVNHTVSGLNLGGTRRVYDAAGRITATYRVGTNGTEKLASSTTYDVAGYAIAQRDAGNRETTTVETFPTLGQLGFGGQDRATYRITTVTNPDGGTQVRKAFNGGFTAEVSGTAVAAPRTVEYGSNGSTGGSFVRELATGTQEKTTTFRNALGQVVTVRLGDGAQSENMFNGLGQMVSSADPDGVMTAFAYDAKGELVAQAIDMDRDGNVAEAGFDRVVRTVVDFVTSHGTTVRRATRSVFLEEFDGTPHVTNVLEESIDGLRTWDTTEGLTTATQSVYDGQGGRTTTTTSPDGVQRVQVFVGDRMISDTTTAAGTVISAQTFVHDVFDRVITITDARNGAAAKTYFADDRVHTVTTPDPDATRSGPGYDAQVTSFTYDAAGRVATVTEPDGAVVNTSYYPTGLTKRVWGGRNYPVEYTYDPQGRVQTLTTWKDFAGNDGQAVTTWNYHPQRGLLLNKRYADDQGVDYTYTSGGRVHTRTGARGVVTLYGYDDAGALNAMDYDDGTPSVGFGYDRLGRLSEKVDGTGACAYTYLGATGLVTLEEHFEGALEGITVTRSYDALLRLTGTAATALPATTYGYDAASRLLTVTTGTHTATYAYAANSSLIESTLFKNGGATRLTATKVFDKLNRLASISSAPSTGLALSHAYTYNAANQRTRTVREDASYWDYGYDALGQVTSGRKLLAGGTAINGLDQAWTYDDIGNRKTALTNGRLSTYTSNDLNQYEERTVPGALDVFGVAAPDATVTLAVNGGPTLPTTRQGGYFYREVTVANSTAPALSSIKVTGVKNNVGPNGEDAIAEETRSALLPQTPEGFAHDADGNLANDGRREYFWDAENRLIETIPLASVAELTPAAPPPRLTFAYDGLGRRIRKQVYTLNAAQEEVLTADTVFLYDGWNVIAELDALNGNAAVRTYTWGLDLSGSMQGAGGVGGLLFANLPATSGPGTTTHYYAYDGNGNVGGLIEAATGAVSASYDYSAMGEVVQSAGAAAAVNPFRFSTKYADVETAHVYYGNRYYGPENGRWLSRDPIEERGGENLQGFVGNAPIARIDQVGLWFETVVAPRLSPFLQSGTPKPVSPLPPPVPFMGPYSNQSPAGSHSRPRWKIENEEEPRPEEWLIRGMTGTLLPDVGETRDKLGVRPGIDVVIVNGTVSTYKPSGKIQGLSTTPYASFHRMHENVLPKVFGGKGEIPLWAIKRTSIARDPKLYLSDDSSAHTTVAPSRCMPYTEYRNALETTRLEWRRILIYFINDDMI